MEKIYSFYENRMKDCSDKVAELKKRIHITGTIRLLLFVGMCGTVYAVSDMAWQIIAGAIALFVIPFIALMVYHTKLFNKKLYAETMSVLCENELKALNYDFAAFDGMKEKLHDEHSFSLDLDLFGERSFVQSINRTITYTGSERLAEWLQTPLTDKTEIIKRQKAVAELASLTDLRQHFIVSGSMVEEKEDSRKKLANLSDAPVYFSESTLWKILIWVFPVVWAILIALTITELVPLTFVSTGIIVSIIVAYSKAKRTNDLHNFVNKLERLFWTYSSLLDIIEKAKFESDLLKEKQNCFTGKIPASKAIKELSRSIGALDQRFSAIGVVLQILGLRDIRSSIRIEKWVNENRQNLILWFDTLADFDALCSMGGFAFNHSGYVYPEISDEYFKMEGKQVGHPLLNRNICVRNDISIAKKPSFLIITGANMAGKSTYLRTVGLNYVIACCGMPICAESMTVYPANLVTSLRTSDNLMSNESYFFAELKRLKMIIDRLQKGEKLFIILDEILKGTNSVDKQKGSLALMKQLVNLDTSGIIATHDLMLGSLETEFPDKIRNYRFEADIRNDELSFSYRLREGIAQNMNACFLMKKMGITV